MAVVITEPVELTDDESAVFLEAYERTGSIRGSARATGVRRRSVYARRYEDPQFRRAFDAVLPHRIESAADELFEAIDEFGRLTGSSEYALDELINCAYNPAAEPFDHEVDAERLADARERLHGAGLGWAAAVIQITATPRLPGLDAALCALGRTS